MEIEDLIDFLETDSLNVTFSEWGLKYLSLRGKRGNRCIDLRAVNREGKPDPMEKRLIDESITFLETGKHQMPLDTFDFTDFQRDVFRAVSRIERGQITTYKGIAGILGKPGAAQAVGSAVAKNPYSYFLPTHRVLPQRGIGICRTGAGYLREKLLTLEGHDLSKLRGNYICSRKKCCME